MSKFVFKKESTMSREWFEVWCDPTLSIPYVLIVIKYPDGNLVVIDPREKKVVFQHNDYETVRLWLLEDEYTRMRGREFDE